MDGDGAVVHMVGNAHIDPVWIWDWHEGMHEVLHTFRAALDRLHDEPRLVFTASSSAFYRWVEQVDPVLFERIVGAVHDGRWVLAGGQWVEPDCNVPSGESVCRQLLYGQRYLAERFGRTATVGWNVDAFGHAGTLPQLLRRGGLRAYVMMRPGEAEKPLPSPVFTWRGPDGTELPAYRVPFDYASGGSDEEGTLRERAGALAALAGELGTPLMCLFGVGDHGGGPTRAALRAVGALEAETGGAVAFGDPTAYFDAVAARQGGLAVVEGELQWHAVGCYSVGAAAKAANRRAERALLTAEATAALCLATTGRDLRVGTEVARGWQALLFSQFHDALGGTCTEEAAEGVAGYAAEALAVADRVTTLALHTLAADVDAWVEGAEAAEGLEGSALAGLPVPLLVCNPLSWPVTATVTVPYPIAACRDAEGAAVPVQHVPSGEATYSPVRTLLRLPVPALGYRRWWLHALEAADPDPSDPAPAAAAVSEAGDAPFELGNGLVTVRIDRATGRLTSLFDHRLGREHLAPEGVRPVLVPDDSDTWSHGVDRYDGTEAVLPLQSAPAVVAEGPLRATVRCRWGGERATVRADVSVWRGEPFVDVDLVVDWHEAHRVLKLVVPLALGDAVSAAGAPYGYVERAPSGHEEPMVHWVGLAERGGAAGLCVTADVTAGYDATGGRLRLTVLRSPRVADHGRGWGADDPDGYPFSDQGRHRLSFRLHPHAGTWADAQPARLADAHLLRAPVALLSWRRGRLGPEASALSVEAGTVTVPVVKRAEDGHATVVRVWEVAGRPTRARVASPLIGRTWEADLGAHEVRTLFVPDDPAAPVLACGIPELVHAGDAGGPGPGGAR